MEPTNIQKEIEKKAEDKLFTDINSFNTEFIKLVHKYGFNGVLIKVLSEDNNSHTTPYLSQLFENVTVRHYIFTAKFDNYVKYEINKLLNTQL